MLLSLAQLSPSLLDNRLVNLDMNDIKQYAWWNLLKLPIVKIYQLFSPPFSLHFISGCVYKICDHLFPAISTAWCHESPRSPLKTAVEHGDNPRKRLDLTEVWFFDPCQLWSFDQVYLNLMNPMLHIDIPQNSYDSFQSFSQIDNSAKACNF